MHHPAPGQFLNKILFHVAKMACKDSIKSLGIKKVALEKGTEVKFRQLGGFPPKKLLLL
jgi:hypothetical protein